MHPRTVIHRLRKLYDDLEELHRAIDAIINSCDHRWEWCPDRKDTSRGWFCLACGRWEPAKNKSDKP